MDVLKALPEKVATSEPYYDLGSFELTVTTDSHEAQIWFNRGYIWALAFGHEEAQQCFLQVIAHDPKCAMGYWAYAYAAGPNYNKMWAMFDARDKVDTIYKCHHVTHQCLDVATNCSPVERALIEALQARFPVDHADHDFSASEIAYANAMREVHRTFGQNDLDIQTLFADALTNSAPRKMFDVKTGEPVPGSPVFEVRELLEASLRNPHARTHPGTAHLYIHLMEMSATPEVALLPAEWLRTMIPDAGHTYHMPTHLDILVGDYGRSMECNMKATHADDKFLRKSGGVNFYSYYRLHNYHSLIYAAMLAGRSQVALEAVTRMEATITEDLLNVQVPPLADWMEFFLAVRVHVYVRFGMWDNLKALELPKDEQLYCVTTVMFLYGRAIAEAATGEVEKACKTRELYRAAALRVPETRLDFPNKMTDILKVASAMLDGELEYRKGNYDEAFVHLREAIKHDDALRYTEPWGWMLPTRHAYGALSLEQGLVEQATMAYAQDLGFEDGITRIHQHPSNVWALHGYYECLMRLGGREKEAKIIHQQLRLRQAEADVDISSSCFCRLAKASCCR